MLPGNANRIFCDNVTCFGTNKAVRIKLLVEEASSAKLSSAKLPRPAVNRSHCWEEGHAKTTLS